METTRLMGQGPGSILGPEPPIVPMGAKVEFTFSEDDAKGAFEANYRRVQALAERVGLHKVTRHGIQKDMLLSVGITEFTSNVRKYGGGKGAIMAEVKQPQQGGDYIEVSVSDEGPGIDLQKLPGISGLDSVVATMDLVLFETPKGAKGFWFGRECEVKTEELKLPSTGTRITITSFPNQLKEVD